MKKIEKAKGVKPLGSSILVEMLSSEEALGTTLALIGKDGKTVNAGAPQGIILALGPKLKAEDLDIGVGDRVLLQGSYVPVPKFEGETRERGIVELHNIKAIFV